MRYCCQASSLEFLCVHNFDFNKCVYEGISYLNEVQVEKLQQYLDSMDTSCGLDRDIDERVLQRCCSQVADWLISAEEGHEVTVNHKGILDYVIHVEIRQRFKNVWTHHGEYCKITVEKISEERRQELEVISIYTEQERILNRMVGFTRVFRVLTECKKPIIGHNMFTDLMLMYDKFYQPLPDRYTEYKKDIHTLFPCIFDTKHIIANMRRSLEDSGLLVSTNLENLFEDLNSEKGKFHVLHSPDVGHAAGFDRYVGRQHPHEAGYDAFMVGYVFLRISHIWSFHGVKSSCAEPLTFPEYLAVMKTFKNSVNIIRANIDHITLGGEDPLSRRPHQLYVRNLRGKLDTEELAQILSAFGSVDIRMQGSSSALVAVGNHRCSKDIFRAFRKNGHLKVAKYDIFKHNSYVRTALWCGVALCGGSFIWAVSPLFTKKL